RPGSFAGPIPGIDAAVFNEQGQAVTGEVGELVVRQPYLGMTLGFWKDRARYLDTYWSRWPDVWVHGDWAMVDAGGLWYILGRSVGKPFKPAAVHVIPRLPKTRNGKILRRVIRNVFVGDPPGDLSSIDDMASLDAIRRLGGRPG